MAVRAEVEDEEIPVVAETQTTVVSEIFPAELTTTGIVARYVRMSLCFKIDRES